LVATASSFCLLSTVFTTSARTSFSSENSVWLRWIDGKVVPVAVDEADRLAVGVHSGMMTKQRASDSVPFHQPGSLAGEFRVARVLDEDHAVAAERRVEHVRLVGVVEGQVRQQGLARRRRRHLGRYLPSRRLRRKAKARVNDRPGRRLERHRHHLAGAGGIAGVAHVGHAAHQDLVAGFAHARRGGRRARAARRIGQRRDRQVGGGFHLGPSMAPTHFVRRHAQHRREAGGQPRHFGGAGFVVVPQRVAHCASTWCRARPASRRGRTSSPRSPGSSVRMPAIRLRGRPQCSAVARPIFQLRPKLLVRGIRLPWPTPAACCSALQRSGM
jgi:hypothetical protein